MADDLPDALADNLAALLVQAKEFQQASRAPSTRRGYSGDFRQFRSWCEMHDCSALPATVETVMAYFTAKVRKGWKVATIIRTRSAIAKAHDLAELPSPTRSAAVAELVAGIKRTIGSEPKRKLALATVDLRAMIESLPTRGALRAKRDKAILLLGFAGALRRSEICGLTVDDLIWSEKGLVLRIRGAKGDRENAGQRVAVPRGRSGDVCPVAAVREWLAAASIDKGPVFRPLVFDDEVENGPLAPQMVGALVKKAGKAIGLDPKALGGHSLRRGMATEAARRQVPLVRLRQHLRHKSVAATMPYIEDEEAFANNPAADLL
ncbi:MAG: site-specific integrase [Magnetospirillum sp.]|nr:site-specific integrase [Magnetospirillum sp.]